MNAAIKKLKSLPLWAKILLALAAAGLVGVAVYLVLGPSTGGLLATAGGGFTAFTAAIGNLLGSGDGPTGEEQDLAAANLERVEGEAADNVLRADADARDALATEAAAAERRARRAGAADGGDPLRVLDRQRRPGGDT